MNVAATQPARPLKIDAYQVVVRMALSPLEKLSDHQFAKLVEFLVLDIAPPDGLCALMLQLMILDLATLRRCALGDAAGQKLDVTQRQARSLAHRNFWKCLGEVNRIKKEQAKALKSNPDPDPDAPAQPPQAPPRQPVRREPPAPSAAQPAPAAPAQPAPADPGPLQNRPSDLVKFERDRRKRDRQRRKDARRQSRRSSK